MSATGTARRLPQLDGLRGLASLGVVFFHFTEVLSHRSAHRYELVERILLAANRTPLYALWQGDSLVLMFFVLSGMALAMMLEGPTYRSYPRYAVARIFRLYPAYAIAILVATLARTFLVPERPLPGLGTWTNLVVGDGPITARMVVDHLVFVGRFATHRIDFVIWSLVQEMRISLVFPFALLLLPARRPRIAVAIVLLLALGSVALSFWIAPLEDGESFLSTVQYLPAFLAGALVAQRRQQVGAAYASWSLGSRWTLGLAGLVLFGYSRFAFDRLPPPFHLIADPARDLLIETGSLALVITCTFESSVARILSTRPFHFLGRISYSLYLYHGVVMLLLLGAFYRRVPLPAIFGTSLVVSIVVAMISQRWIEQPLSALGKRLALRL